MSDPKQDIILRADLLPQVACEDCMRLRYYGTPLPLGRPRVLKTGRTFLPKRSRTYRDDLLAQLAPQIAQQGGPLGGALEAQYVFCMPVPLSLSQKRKEALFGTDCTKQTGDASNLVKAVEDALNGLAFADDSQITRYQVHKIYETEADKPGFEMCIWPIETLTDRERSKK